VVKREEELRGTYCKAGFLKVVIKIGGLQLIRLQDRLSWLLRRQQLGGVRFVEFLVWNNGAHMLKGGIYIIVHTPRLSDDAAVLSKSKCIVVVKREGFGTSGNALGNVWFL
jgi:hypothetical protein